MRRRISALVAATTSAVILAFLIPTGLLVSTLARDRAVAGASQEAQEVATLLAGVKDVGQLTDLVGLVDDRSSRASPRQEPYRARARARRSPCSVTRVHRLWCR